ncbi:hypothetical protein CFP56_025457, partial [Quercus suber]
KKKKKTSFHSELEKQVKEARNRLLNPPFSIYDHLTLLDEVENLLAYMEQVPSKSIHAKMDVNVSVVSCIIGVTRIIAPDALYEDEQMKEIFQLIFIWYYLFLQVNCIFYILGHISLLVY